MTLPNLVPALVSGQRIYIECPSWCTVDHVASPEAYLEDVWHVGADAELFAPRIGKRPDLVLFARLGLDPFDPAPERRQTFVTVDDGSEGYYMAPEQAEEFASNLEAFAARVRDMARVAKRCT